MKFTRDAKDYNDNEVNKNFLQRMKTNKRFV